MRPVQSSHSPKAAAAAERRASAGAADLNGAQEAKAGAQKAAGLAKAKSINTYKAKGEVPPRASGAPKATSASKASKPAGDAKARSKGVGKGARKVAPKSDVAAFAPPDRRQVLQTGERKASARVRLAVACSHEGELDVSEMAELNAAMLEASEAGLDPTEGQFVVAEKKLQDQECLAISKPSLFQVRMLLLPYFQVVPYGLLGTAQKRDGIEVVLEGKEPTSGDCLICPLVARELAPRLQVAGTKSIINWIGLENEPSFPRGVLDAMQQSRPRAKFHKFSADQSEEGRLCICVSLQHLDLYTTAEDALTFLVQAYKAVFEEFGNFLRSGPRGRVRLRLLPFCGGQTAGKFTQAIPTLTAQAICIAFLHLADDDSALVQRAERIDLCIYEEDEYEQFRAAFALAESSSLPLPSVQLIKFTQSNSTPQRHPVCQRATCGKATWNGERDEWCSTTCKALAETTPVQSKKCRWACCSAAVAAANAYCRPACQEQDMASKAGESATHLCKRPCCGKPTWDGKADQFCGVACSAMVDYERALHSMAR